MAVAITATRMDEVLADAVSLEHVAEHWTGRIERVCDGPSKTIIAALGGALLAKRAAPEIQIMQRRTAAGPEAYSHRVVTEHLARWSSVHGVHIGATGRNPVNQLPVQLGRSAVRRDQQGSRQRPWSVQRLSVAPARPADCCSRRRSDCARHVPPPASFRSATHCRRTPTRDPTGSWKARSDRHVARAVRR